MGMMYTVCSHSVLCILSHFLSCSDTEGTVTRRMHQLLLEAAASDAANAVENAQLELLLGGVAALLMFSQFNWTGTMSCNIFFIA